MHPDWLNRSNFRLCRSGNLPKDSHQNSWIYPRVNLEGSIFRDKMWEKIGDNLNGLKLSGIKVSKRAVRERYTLLREKFKAKMKDEEKASGIECDLSKVGKALEEMAEKRNCS